MMSGALPVATDETRGSSEPDPDRPMPSIEKTKPPRAPTPSLSDLDKTSTDSDTEDPQSPVTGLDRKYLTGKSKRIRPRTSSPSSNGAEPGTKRLEQGSSCKKL
jgi:hypothetical protein